MKSSDFSLAAPFAIAFLLAGMCGSASAGTYINVSYPGAYTTTVACVNNNGDAVGGWSSGNPTAGGGFLRLADGTFYSIVISGATGTNALGINDSGQVVGYYQDENYVFHGYLRNLAGEFTTLNAPGAGWGRSYTGTYALAINDSGEIAGFYVTEQQVQHGFIRDAAGNYTSFDPPGSTATSAHYINAGGEIAGTFATSTTEAEGFLRDALGNITTFTVSGATTRYGIYVTGLNSSGEIAGYYEDGDGYGFLRDASGNITSFTLPYGGSYGVRSECRMMATSSDRSKTLSSPSGHSAEPRPA